MKGKRVLAAFLLGVGLCFVPAVGYGELQEIWWEALVKQIHLKFLEAKIDYIMRNPTSFLDVKLDYDTSQGIRIEEGVMLPTKQGKILVRIFDNRGVFSYKPRVALLDEFKRHLKVIYSFIKHIATDIDTDIVAEFYSQEGILLGGFDQGEYHLWEK